MPLIHKALLLESLANIFGAVQMLFLPRFAMSFLVPPSSPYLTPQTFQFFGGFVITLTVPFLYAYSDNNPGRIACRRLTYLTAGIGEIVLISLILWQKSIGVHLFTENATIGTVAILGAATLWRIWCLYIQPEIMNGARKGKGKAL